MARVLRLSPTDRRLLTQALALVAAVRLGLWLLPFRTVRRLLASAEPGVRAPAGRAALRGPLGPVGLAPRTAASGESVVIERIAWAVTHASRCVPAATCLTQALAAQFLLQRHGIPARLHIGVAREEDGRLAAHAWVECQGQVVVGGVEIGRYTPLLVLEEEPR